MGTQPPPLSGTPLIFGPCLLWPNGWTDQDATWYRGRARPRRHCVRWGPSSPSPKTGAAAPYFRPMYCGQTAGWIKMPLGTEVGLGLGHIVLNGNPAPLPRKRHSTPTFRSMSIVVKCINGLGRHLVWR